MLPKIKELKLIYSFKLRVRDHKRYLKDIFFMFYFFSPIKYIFKFTINHFKNYKLDKNYNSYYESKKFSDFDWFLDKMPLFEKYFNKYEMEKKKINNILEIGSYEGRSAIILLNFFKNSSITCVDIWNNQNEYAKLDMFEIEKNFDFNLNEYKNRVNKIKNNSDNFFNKNTEKFDLIYVDGYHYYDQVLRDAENSFKNLNIGGYILFDDYNHRYNGFNKKTNLFLPINKFLKNNLYRLELIYVHKQVLIKKISWKSKIRKNTYNKMKIFPAIDIKDKKCVRLVKGNFDNKTEYEISPVDQAGKYNDHGFKNLHIVDLDGALTGETVNLDIIQEIVSKFDFKIEIGGGVRNFESIQKYADVGVEKVILGSAAIKDKNFLKEACQKFPNKIALGLDAKDGYLSIYGWKENSNQLTLDYLKEVNDYGASRLIYTDINRDGMKKSPNFEETSKIANTSSCPVIISGGVSSIDDIKKAKELNNKNIEGIIVGKAIYDGDIDLDELVKELDA